MLEIYIFKKELVKKTVIFPQKTLEVVGSTDPDIVHWGPFFDTPLSKNLDFAPPPEFDFHANKFKILSHFLPKTSQSPRQHSILMNNNLPVAFRWNLDHVKHQKPSVAV